MTDTISKYNPSVLVHHGVKGQKWGVRRYQNKDGSLTSAGMRHVGLKGDDNPRLPTGYNGGLSGARKEQQSAINKTIKTPLLKKAAFKENTQKKKDS